jgi:hypothetical protein
MAQIKEVERVVTDVLAVQGDEIRAHVKKKLHVTAGYTSNGHMSNGHMPNGHMPHITVTNGSSLPYIVERSSQNFGIQRQLGLGTAAQQN